ncbi:alpha/beta hydrolase domain-containing protein [Parafrankia soli]|uniref:alpha/beta hydrolase domain-containing protein n=1 Tax=Parafrankia soli TaxID=2599596 RepID=UPI003B5880B1
MPFPRLPGRRVTALLAAAACTSAVLAVRGPAATAAPGAGAKAGAVASPTITEPAAGSHGFPFQAEDPALLAARGYVEREFLFGGTATAYNRNGTFGSDGRWQVTPGTQAPYQGRMLVRYPSDPAKFNGTVLVEWFNVSGGIDAQVDWTTMRDEIQPPRRPVLVRHLLAGGAGVAHPERAESARETQVHEAARRG